MEGPLTTRIFAEGFPSVKNFKIKLNEISKMNDINGLC